MKKILLFSFFSLLSCASFAQNNPKKMDNLHALHDAAKSLSAKPLFKGTEASVTSLQLKQNGLLPEHITKVEALLVCVVGEVVFENEKGEKMTLKAGDYLRIEPMVKHWVKGIADSQLLLVK